mmetsp:Transcript_2526/g.5846  ORF Transcript_2526/g.5846 Transcript_2526/m.5846 type:complete len:287 (-) Transcript_2526:291-1151(-)
MEESHSGEECGVGEVTVVKLDGTSVLKDVAPGRLEGVVPNFLGDPVSSVEWPIIVSASSIVSSDKGARDESHTNEREDSSAPLAELEDLRVHSSGQEGLGVESSESSPHKASENTQSHSQVSCQAVWAHAGLLPVMGGLLKATLNHPPTHETLAATESQQTKELRSHSGQLLDTTAGHEVHKRQSEDYTKATAPHAVKPFHKVNVLELLERHALVHTLVLRELFVLLKLNSPSSIIFRQHRSLGPPVYHGQSGPCQPSYAAQDHHAEDCRRCAQKPISYPTVAHDG